jgi:hypothetical protein
MIKPIAAIRQYMAALQAKRQASPT